MTETRPKKTLAELQPATFRFVPGRAEDPRSLLEVTSEITPDGVLHVQDLEDITDPVAQRADGGAWRFVRTYRTCDGSSVWYLVQESIGRNDERWILQRADVPVG